jgi:hypothetical protein
MVFTASGAILHIEVGEPLSHVSKEHFLLRGNGRDVKEIGSVWHFCAGREEIGKQERGTDVQRTEDVKRDELLA